MFVERYYQIGKSNLKYNYFPHMLLSILFLVISPFLMGVENLDAIGTAKVLEMYVALIGILLLTPVYLPELNTDIKDLVEAKYTSHTAVILIRVLEACLSLLLLIGVFVLILRKNHCDFPLWKYYLGTLAEALFLGGMGMCAYSIFDQIAVAYLFPLMYYILAFSGGQKLLKDFYLFSMTYGGYQEKANLAVTGICFIIVAIGYPYITKRILPKLIHHKINPDN